MSFYGSHRQIRSQIRCLRAQHSVERPPDGQFHHRGLLESQICRLSVRQAQ